MRTSQMGTGRNPSNRMLKKSASFVLASLKGSPYSAEYDSPFLSLRPRWTAFLTILRDSQMIVAATRLPCSALCPK
jgi:hypothetical protein